MTIPIRPKDRDAVIQSLRAGVVPRTGQHLIQVGRVNEIGALIKDIERVADSGSCIRFVIGEYGSGKTFFLNLVRAIALEKRLVTIHADLTPDRWPGTLSLCRADAQYLNPFQARRRGHAEHRGTVRHRSAQGIESHG